MAALQESNFVAKLYELFGQARNYPFGAAVERRVAGTSSNQGANCCAFFYYRTLLTSCETNARIADKFLFAVKQAIGGYLAGRMRTKITGLHTNEVFFRDTAHGFLAWAFATLISATALAAATAYLANGAFAGLSGLSGQSAQAVDPAQIYVDKLFRTTTPAADNGAAVNADNTAAQSNTRAEILRLWKADFRKDDIPIERSHLPSAGSRSARHQQAAMPRSALIRLG